MSLHNEIDEMIQEDPRVYVKFIEDFSVGFYGLKNSFWKKIPGAFAWAKAQAFYRCLTREKITTKTRCQPVSHKTGTGNRENASQLMSTAKLWCPWIRGWSASKSLRFFFREQEELIRTKEAGQVFESLVIMKQWYQTYKPLSNISIDTTCKYITK